MEKKFRKGQKVKVIDSGYMYTTHSSIKYKSDDDREVEDGEILTVIRGPFEINRNEFAYELRSKNGNNKVVGVDGLTGTL